METPHRARPPPTTPAAAESSDTVDCRWIAALSELELDLKMLAVKRAETSGRPYYLADALDLRTLRAPGVVLLESFKGRLKETSVDLTVLDRLVLSRDTDVDVNVSSSVRGVQAAQQTSGEAK